MTDTTIWPMNWPERLQEIEQLQEEENKKQIVWFSEERDRQKEPGKCKAGIGYKQVCIR